MMKSKEFKTKISHADSLILSLAVLILSLAVVLLVVVLFTAWLWCYSLQSYDSLLCLTVCVSHYLRVWVCRSVSHCVCVAHCAPLTDCVAHCAPLTDCIAHCARLTVSLTVSLTVPL